MLIPPDVPLSARAFEFLTKLVYDRSRIRLGPDRQALVASRLRQRVQSLGLSDYEAYCSLLRAPEGEDEVDALIDLISTNHTHFFREPAHFELLSRHILPQMADGVQGTLRQLRFWSAAASSGEETYSLAIVLAEFCRNRPWLQWHIDASDISQRMLHRCQQGIYEADKVELPVPEWRERYFQRGIGEREGCLRIKQELRRHVSVHSINLFQDAYPVSRGLDVIFCRNVMIYFDVPSRSHLVERLTDMLVPGGYLFVGHSESLIGIRHGLTSVWPSVYIRPQ
ncbi:MAG: protein-glutamate O-methyltransferase CheR [Planctomycetota bacterium]|nr:MAG: protein-glutamate O-methyltransferase CheR [Planctomycetota bacterium]